MLVYDLETAPNLGWVWARWDTNVVEFNREWHILSCAWKWLGERTTHVVGLPDFPLYGRDPDNDRDLVKHIRKLFDEADIAVTHNGKSFDAPKAQTRMMVHGLDPPSSFKDIDTLKIARQQFAFTSNRLGDLCSSLGIATKADAGGFKTWLGCMNGDARAWARMKKYNRQDVLILEQLYLRFRAWIPRHPNMAAFGDRPKACPRCGSTEGMMARGHHVYAVSRRRRYQCKTCRGYCLGRPMEKLANEFVAA